MNISASVSRLSATDTSDEDEDDGLIHHFALSRSLPRDYQLRDSSILLFELMEYMGAMYTLIRNSSCEESRHYIVIPPNRSIEDCVISRELHVRGGQQRVVRRLPQKIVRLHILRGGCDAELFTLTGLPAVVNLDVDGGSTGMQTPLSIAATSDRISRARDAAVAAHSTSSGAFTPSSAKAPMSSAVYSSSCISGSSLNESDCSSMARKGNGVQSEDAYDGARSSGNDSGVSRTTQFDSSMSRTATTIATTTNATTTTTSTSPSSCRGKRKGTVTVVSKNGEVTTVRIKRIYESAMTQNKYFTFLVTDGALCSETDYLSAQEMSNGITNSSSGGSESLDSSRSDSSQLNNLGNAVNPYSLVAHIWQKLPSVKETIEFATTVRGHALKSDENTVRALLEEVVEQKRRHHLAASSSLREQLDAALMYVDTEVAIMRTSYVCMSGFEALTIQKVNQIVDNAADMLFVQQCNSVWTDEEREDIAVAFHTIASGGVASKLTEHWDEEYFNATMAFTHACFSLKHAGQIPSLLPAEVGGLVTAETLVGAANQLACIDYSNLSVLSYMRVLESVVSETVAATVEAGVTTDLTADVCIPLIAVAILVAAPQHLPSRIQFLSSFGMAVLEMSSLGYAVATFEAAVSLILDAYRNYVLSRE